MTIRLRSWLLLGLCTASLATVFGCSLVSPEARSFADLRGFIAAEVGDQERADAMIEELDQAEGLLLDFQAGLRELGVEMREVNARHEASREHVDGLFQRHNRLRARVQVRLLDSMLAMRELATEAEWVAIVDRSVAVYRQGLMQAGFADRKSPATEEEG